MTLQSLVLGDQKIETEPQKRKILLGAYLIFTFLGLDFFFLIVSLVNPLGESWSLLAGVFISIICLALIRTGKIDAAIFLHLLRSNFVVFYFSMIDTDPYQTATYVYFFISCIGALAVFGYKERWKGLGFSFLSFALFLIAYFDRSRFSVNDTHFYFILNFSIVLLIGMAIMMFFDRLVAASEKAIVQKNLELIEANSELLKTNKELDRFVYSASHDLRAPLSSMLGLIEIAQKTEDHKEVNQYLQMIKGRVLVLDAFIRQIVDYSRNSRLEPKIEPVEVKSVIDEVVEQLKFLPDFESVKIKIDLPEAWSIASEKNRLKIIFENIISNAIKYRNQTNGIGHLKITGKETDLFHNFEIEDNGIGIAPEHVTKVFEMFYRAHEGSQGSGLGLYIVKETITKLGGSIDVKSQVGKGSTFMIGLPKN
jgi:signal transduction histidine kinase